MCVPLFSDIQEHSFVHLAILQRVSQIGHISGAANNSVNPVTTSENRGTDK
jgi:hypothetical protein